MTVNTNEPNSFSIAAQLGRSLILPFHSPTPRCFHAASRRHLSPSSHHNRNFWLRHQVSQRSLRSYIAPLTENWRCGAAGSHAIAPSPSHYVFTQQSAQGAEGRVITRPAQRRVGAQLACAQSGLAAYYTLRLLASVRVSVGPTTCQIRVRTDTIDHSSTVHACERLQPPKASVTLNFIECLPRRDEKQSTRGSTYQMSCLFRPLLFCLSRCLVKTVEANSVHKKYVECFFAITVKLFTNFHHIWHVAAAINAEQCALKLSTSPGVCIHYFVIRETEL